jgi:hypothetical protein
MILHAGELATGKVEAEMVFQAAWAMEDAQERQVVRAGEP